MTKRIEPVAEVVCRLESEGELLHVFRCSPGGYEQLAAGWLLGAGVITAGEAVPDFVRATADGVEVVRTSLSASQRARVAWSNPPTPVRPARPSPARASPPALARMPDLLRRLYADAERYRDTGGVHAAALFEGEEMLIHAEDVGRHNTVDRVLGGALAEGLAMEKLGLVLSARVSGEIAQKAARAGLAWIASRSLPTTLAVDIARSARMPIIARAGTDAATVFGLVARPEES